MDLDFTLIITAYIVFVYSTVCHEAAHAYVAHKLGDSTAYLGGQVSLDPIPHIKREPVGMVFLPLFMLFTTGRLIGWASAPLDPLWVIRFPKRSALVAMAGPLANFFLCIIAAIIMFIGVKNGVFKYTGSLSMFGFIGAQAGTGWELMAQVLSVTFTLNLLLGVFNLMPLPPLDGSNIPLFFLNERAAEQYQQMLRQPWTMLITLVLAFQLFPLIYYPIFRKVAVFMNRWLFL